MSDNSKPDKLSLGKLPPKPKEPESYECCGRGCDPCIYDYYAKSLARWHVGKRKWLISKHRKNCNLPAKLINK